MSFRNSLGFGFMEALIWLALLAIGTWTVVFPGDGDMFLWLVLYGLNLRFLVVHARRIPRIGSRRAMLRKCFWRVFCLALPIAVCIHLVTYLEFRRNYAAEGYQGVGWPIPFVVYGGMYDAAKWNFAALIVDLAFSLGIAAATAMALRDGGQRFTVVTARFWRGKILWFQRPGGPTT